MKNFTIPKCPHCGKELPFSLYGGVGPCNCEGYKKASREMSERYQAAEDARKAREHEELHAKANSCNHEWEGGSLAGTRCRKCGISLGDYFAHK